jgi:hypothetical protein
MTNPISMYFKYSGKNRPEVRSLSTFDAILNGERTATTRFEDWYKGRLASYEGLKAIVPGAEMSFMDTQRFGDNSRIVKVKTTPSKLSGTQGYGGSAYELTMGDMEANPQWLERWSKLEGWSPSAGLEFFRKYKKGVQIPFTLPQREIMQQPSENIS